ncbi:MAG TPA: hypothetical protein VJR89_34060, partial [Polyangiales bacterium]|nr:hypothetical protein [Polyangiales bacterium]
LSRQERKKITQELIRERMPGISDREIEVLMSRRILPLKDLKKRFSSDEISRGVRRQLLDAVNNAIGFGSYAKSKVSEPGQTGQVGDLLFGVVNAYETM